MTWASLLHLQMLTFWGTTCIRCCRFKRAWFQIVNHRLAHALLPIATVAAAACIGVGRCCRLGGPGDTIARKARAKKKKLTTPTFRSNHAHLGINEAFVTRRQGVLGCKTSNKSSWAYFEAIYPWIFMWWLIIRPMLLLICVLTGCILGSLATSQSGGWNLINLIMEIILLCYSC